MGGVHPTAGPAGGRRRDEGDVGGGCPPVSGGNGSQMCVSGEGGPGTRTAPLRAPTVPQPPCWPWGGVPDTSGPTRLGRCGIGGGLPLPFSPRPEGRRGAGVGRAGGARGRGLGRPGPRCGQHDRAVPLLPALGTARTGGSRTAAPRGPGRAGVAPRGWTRGRAVDGTGGEREGAGGVCTGSG